MSSNDVHHSVRIHVHMSDVHNELVHGGLVRGDGLEHDELQLVARI